MAPRRYYQERREEGVGRMHQQQGDDEYQQSGDGAKYGKRK